MQRIVLHSHPVFAQSCAKKVCLNKMATIGTVLLVGLSFPAYGVDKAKEEVTFTHKIHLSAGTNTKVDDHAFVGGNMDLALQRNFAADTAFKAGVEGPLKFYGPHNRDNRTAYLPYVEAITPLGTLRYGGIDKKGASELYYIDLDNMAIDVVKYVKKYNSLRWVGQVGDLNYAVSTLDVNKKTFDKRKISLGLSYPLNDWRFAAGYDFTPGKRDKTLGVSARYTQKWGDIKHRYTVSYITQKAPKAEKDAHALGLDWLIQPTDALSFGLHYAFNSGKSFVNGYGFSAIYKQPNWRVVARWDSTERDKKKVKFNTQFKWPDLGPAGTELYTGYQYQEKNARSTGVYAGLLVGLDKRFKVGAAYSKVHEGGELNFLRGTSFFFRIDQN